VSNMPDLAGTGAERSGSRLALDRIEKLGHNRSL